MILFMFGSLALVARLAYWQVVDREQLTIQAVAQTTVTVETPSKRGDIYDRTGTIVLAMTGGSIESPYSAAFSWKRPNSSYASSVTTTSCHAANEHEN